MKVLVIKKIEMLVTSGIFRNPSCLKAREIINRLSIVLMHLKAIVVLFYLRLQVFVRIHQAPQDWLNQSLGKIVQMLGLQTKVHGPKVRDIRLWKIKPRK